MITLNEREISLTYIGLDRQSQINFKILRDAIVSDIISIRTDLLAFDSSIADLQSDFIILASSVTTLQTDVSALESDVSALESDVSALESDMSQAESDISDLQSDKLNISDIDDSPADDADTCVSSQWVYNKIYKANKISSIHTVTDDDYDILDNDTYTTFLFSTGASTRTLTLPTAADNEEREIEVFKIDSGSGYVTIDGEGAETINGLATRTIFNQYGMLGLKCNGTEWIILDIRNVFISDIDTSIRTYATPGNATWRQPAGSNLSIVLPIGKYKIFANITVELDNTGAGHINQELQLGTSSTPGSSLIGKKFYLTPNDTVQYYTYNTINIAIQNYTVTTPITLYVNQLARILSGAPTITNIHIRGDLSESLLQAELVG